MHIFLIFVLQRLLFQFGLGVFDPEKMGSYYYKLRGIIGVDLLRKDEDGNCRRLPHINADIVGWNKMPIEYGTKTFLFKNPRSDFNEFWKGQISPYLKEGHEN